MRVSDILSAKGDKVVTAKDSLPLSAALEGLAAANIGALVVEDAHGALAGLFSEREAVAALARHGAGALRRPLREVMVVRPATVEEADVVVHAMTVMTERRARHLPVLADGRLVGIVSLGDLVKARLSEKVEENLVLPDLARWNRAA